MPVLFYVTDSRKEHFTTRVYTAYGRVYDEYNLNLFIKVLRNTFWSHCMTTHNHLVLQDIAINKHFQF